MTVGRELIADLAIKASKDAIEAVLRTAKLAPTAGDSIEVLSLALALIEAKGTTIRAFLPSRFDTNALVKELVEVESKSLDAVIANVFAREFGRAADVAPVRT